MERMFNAQPVATKYRAVGLMAAALLILEVAHAATPWPATRGSESVTGPGLRPDVPFQFQ
jgi:hypothetical protein